MEHEAELLAKSREVEDALILGREWRRCHSELEDELAKLKEELRLVDDESRAKVREGALEVRIRELEAEKRGMKTAFDLLLKYIKVVATRDHRSEEEKES